MVWIRGSVAAIVAALTLAQSTPASTAGRKEPTTLLRISSAALGLEVRFRGILLLPGEPMRVVELRTPMVIRTKAPLILAAFEPLEAGAILRLDYVGDDTIPTTVVAPRVMVGRAVGGATTAFVQGY